MRAGDPLRFRVALFGSARQHLGAFLEAIERALRHGLGPRKAPFRLDWARTPGLEDAPGQPSARAIPLYADGRFVQQAALPDTTLGSLARLSAAQHGATVRLALHTPVHLVAGGCELRQLDPALLVQRLVERVQRLAFAWGQVPAELALPWEALVDLASAIRVDRVQTHWVSFERKSQRHAQRVPMSGLVGFVDLSNVPEPLLPLLGAAEYVHLGKQAAFGFGRIGLRRRARL